MTNHREKSQPKLKTLYDKIYNIFIDLKVLVEGPAHHRLPPVFVNKIVLQHSHTHLFTYCLCCFCNTTAELSSCNRNLLALQSLEYFVALY